MLLRLARRLTIWEGDVPAAEIQKVEFRDRNTGGPDLRPSVYDIEDQQPDIIRACAEHSAAVPLDPARGAAGISCDGVGHRIVVKDGSPKFQYIRTHHREVELADENALTTFIEDLKASVSDGKIRTVTKNQIVDYAKGRVEAGDVEWLAVVRDPDTRQWLRKLGP